MKIQWEYERKFLVNPAALPALPRGVRIEQAYLGFEPVVRVRLEGDRGVLTVKGPGLRARREVNLSIPAEAARALIELRVEGTTVIRKTRHLVLHGGHVWEVDVFAEPFRGLVTAEVELRTPDEVPELPPWVGQEVTDHPRFQNAALARTGRIPPPPPPEPKE
ncbi:MAG: CYTH domain-containing protein [Deltaproteobacteria bacterium]|nr:CYTH domain-containing protein [Deltaproteobacteria bacterium]